MGVGNTQPYRCVLYTDDIASPLTDERTMPMRRFAIFLAAATTLALAATTAPARADDAGWRHHAWRDHAQRQHEWQKHAWRRHEWRGHREWHPRYYGYSTSYAPAYRRPPVFAPAFGIWFPFR
jgi:hypothetical protein